ncbi:protein phosphatase 2C domain-containing protein [uncultured Clostridium sp.]|uniref:PP2C family protein-serine/threonine phosphatase n=1 Tax=uncultured Clostridium sp. TaxID=59620 RepID=UPI0025FB515B|nr:protein phosphatase 2C domain-containing protein [uncultured Clostridium sp.]
MKKYKIATRAISDVGVIKKVNEDSIIVKLAIGPKGNHGIFAIFDGLGGLKKGDKASGICKSIFEHWWNNKIKVLPSLNDTEIINSINDILYYCNNEISIYGEENNINLGSTASILLIVKGKYYIAHVGDSRIYKYKKGLEQLTEDHSLVALKVKKGEMTLEESKVSKEKNILLQCIGIRPDIEIYNKIGSIKDGDKFILCSDGFSNRLQDIEICDLFNYEDRGISLKETIDLVKSRGERDNISAIVLDVEKDVNPILKRIMKLIRR